MISVLRFSVVTVCYKQKEHLRELIETLPVLDTALTVLEEVIVVDNYGDCEAFPKMTGLPSVVTIASENVGYLRGLGIGVQQALQRDIDFVVLCNPDIKFMTPIENDVIQALENMWVVAPQIIDIDGKQQNPNRIAPFTTFELWIWDLMATKFYIYKLMVRLKRFLKQVIVHWRGLTRQQLYVADGPIFLPHGSCMLMSAQLLKKAKFFDEDIFLWGEEAVIAGLAREFGSGVCFVSSLRVEHASHSATAKIIPEERFRIWQQSWKRYRKYLHKK